MEAGHRENSVVPRATRLAGSQHPGCCKTKVKLNLKNGDHSLIDCEGLTLPYQSMSGTKLHVVVAGNTNNTHTAIVTYIINIGYKKVPSPENCDFILLFCPVVSRVGTDIGEALQIVDRDKDKVLVVMHHTFNPSTVIAESRRQVEDPNVLLTVDFLFYENKLLNCDRNSIARDQICRFLAVPPPQTSCWKKWIKFLFLPAVAFFGTAIIIANRKKLYQYLPKYTFKTIAVIFPKALQLLGVSKQTHLKKELAFCPVINVESTI